MNHTCRFGLIAALALPWLTVGCVLTPAVYHEPSHRTLREQANLPNDELRYPEVTLAVGEVRRFTTPAKGWGPHGWWLSVVTEDPAIARAVAMDGDYTRGTAIEGVSVGRTRAVYGNAAAIHRTDGTHGFTDQTAPFFWINVVDVTESDG